MKERINTAIRNIGQIHTTRADAVKQKTKIRVLFLLILKSNWKYDALYWELYNSNDFEPIVFICPFTRDKSKVEQVEDVKENEEFCISNNYDYVVSWSDTDYKWIDVEQINPDVIFFTNPHNITHKKYQIEKLFKYLTCYVPYSIRADHLTDLAFNRMFEQITWKNFYESDEHRSIAEKNAFNKGQNVKVAGYPTVDQIVEQMSAKEKSDKITIIWAPHWTIPGASTLLDRSCFLEYAEYFKNLSIKYKDTVNLIFRPHPFLKDALHKHKQWGKDKTDKYYSFWKGQENTEISDGNYIDDFVRSDMLVHDSVSFLAEYMATENPAIFTKKESRLNKPHNSFGKKCLEAHYIVENITELDSQLENIFQKKEDFDDYKYLSRKNIKDQLTMSESSSKIIKNYLLNELR